MRYAMQAGAREILGNSSGVYHCLRTVRSKKGVEVWHSAERKSAHYGNLRICGLHWVCPVCAVKIVQHRAGEVARAVSLVQEHGGTVVFQTLTLPHYAGQHLPTLLNEFLAAVRSFKGRRLYRDVMASLEHLGEIRSLETTIGVNGWHPHTHSLHFFDGGPEEMEKAREELSALWGRVVAKRGLGEVHEVHGLDFQIVGSRESGEESTIVAEYVAKAADGLEERFKGGRWEAWDELARGNSKQARRGGRTPFALLADYALAGDEEAGELFRDYAGAFKGKNHLRWSKGLREALGLSLVPLTDQEAAELEIEPASLLGLLSRYEWKVILAAGVRAKSDLLDVAAEGNWAAVESFVAGLMVPARAVGGSSSGHAC